MSFFSAIEIEILIFAICGHLVYSNDHREILDSGYKNVENKVFCLSPLLCLLIKKDADKTGQIEKIVESNLDLSNPSISKSTKSNILKTIVGLRSVISSLEKLLEREIKRDIHNNEEAIEKELELFKKEKEITREDADTKKKTIDIFLDLEKNNIYAESKDEEQPTMDVQLLASPYDDYSTKMFFDARTNSDAFKINDETVTKITNHSRLTTVKPLSNIGEKFHSIRESRAEKGLSVEVREVKELLRDLLQLSLTSPQPVSLNEANKLKREQEVTQSELPEAPENASLLSNLIQLFTNASSQTEAEKEKNDSIKIANDITTQIMNLEYASQEPAKDPQVKTQLLSTPNDNSYANTTINAAVLIPQQTLLDQQIDTTNEIIPLNITDLPKTKDAVENNEENSLPQQDSETVDSDGDEAEISSNEVPRDVVLSKPSNVLLRVNEVGKNQSIEIITGVSNNISTEGSTVDPRQLQIDISIDPNLERKPTLVEKSEEEGNTLSEKSLNEEGTATELNKGNLKTSSNDDLNHILRSLYKKFKARHVVRDIPMSSAPTIATEEERLEETATSLPVDVTQFNENLLLEKLIEQLKKVEEKKTFQDNDATERKILRTSNLSKLARNQRFSETELILRSPPILDDTRKQTQDAKAMPVRENTKKSIAENNRLKNLIAKISNEYSGTGQQRRRRQNLMKTKINHSAELSQDTTPFSISEKTPRSTSPNRFKLAFHYLKFHGGKDSHFIKRR